MESSTGGPTSGVSNDNSNQNDGNHRKRDNHNIATTDQGINNKNNSSPELNDQTQVPITYLEFYAGVGGWGMALEEACHRINKKNKSSSSSSKKMIKTIRIDAFDVMDTAIEVIKYNSHRNNNKNASTTTPATKRLKPPSGTTDITRLSLPQLSTHNADVWAMSPPCQPHTRQNESPRDDEDPRSRSFLHLCEILETMEREVLPRLILMENVVGFESSRCCERYRRVLSQRGYAVGHFEITPTQVGMPNDRPRYYSVGLLLRRTNDAAAGDDDDSLWRFSSLVARESLPSPVMIQTRIPSLTTAPPPPSPSSKQSQQQQQQQSPKLHPIAHYLDDDLNETKLSPLLIPPQRLQSTASWCFDIVTPLSTRSSCFTHSYGRFNRGTGSVLYMLPPDSSNDDDDDAVRRLELVAPADRSFDPEWSRDLDTKRLRYFSGMEVARLLGFPEWFGFPEGFTVKQQWKLLGNSLNVRVAGVIAEVGLGGLFEGLNLE